MANEYRVNNSDLTAVADAIREKSGTSDPMSFPAGFVEAIAGISAGGGEIVPLTVTENGTYTPPEGADGYSPVEVMVAPEAGDIDKMIDRSITEITSGVTYIGSSAFAGCKYLKRCTLTKAEGGLGTDGHGSAFSGCGQLIEVIIPNLKTVASNMFFQCYKLEAVNFPKVTSIDSNAFSACTALKEVHFSDSFNLTSSARSCFQGCGFEVINMLNMPNMSNVTMLPSSCFASCRSLAMAVLPKVKSIEGSAFQYCEALETIDFYALESISGYYNFEKCSVLTALILRNESNVCTLKTSSQFNTTPIKDGTGYIYVPAALVDSYKTATNWTTFANQFRALEDYTVDGTITGELDPAKTGVTV